MAKYFCQISEDRLWQIISESCRRNDAMLQRDGSSTAAIVISGLIRGAWRIEVAVAEHESESQTIIRISASLSSSIIWLRRVLVVIGVGLCIWSIAGMRGHDPEVTPLLFMALGMLVLTAFLVLQFLVNRHPQALLTVILNDLQSMTRLRSIEPFELKASWWESHIALPLLAALFFAHIPMILGPVVGIALLVPACTAIFSLVVVKSRLKGWRGVLHGVHCIWTRIAITGAGPIVAAILTGTMLHCRAYHPATFRSSGMQVLSKAIILGSSDERNWQTSVVTMAKEIMGASSLPSDVQAAVAIVVAIAIFLLLWSAFRGVTDGMRYWDTANLSEHSPVTVTSPSAQHESLARRDMVLIAGYALLLGACYWFLALLSVDVIAYFLFGKPLILYFIGWSLELLKTMFQATGLSVLAASACVTAIFITASLPGLAMLCTAFTRMVRQMLSMPAMLRPRDSQEKYLVSEYGEWIGHTSDKAGIPSPRLRIIHNESQQIYSERSIIPMLPGRILISDKSLASLGRAEIEALLAHEIHHLKRNAWHIEVLKALSNICLFPMYYFLILYDFPRHEYEADAFAVNTTGNGEALKSALVKLHVAGSVDSGHPPIPSLYSLPTRWFGRLRSRSRFLRALSLYFDDSIFVAAYPTLTERIGHIDNLDDTLETQRV